jgi:hypothetical protein
MKAKLTTAEISGMSRREIADKLTAMSEYTADWRERSMAKLRRHLGIATHAIILPTD